MTHVKVCDVHDNNMHLINNNNSGVFHPDGPNLSAVTKLLLSLKYCHPPVYQTFNVSWSGFSQSSGILRFPVIRNHHDIVTTYFIHVGTYINILLSTLRNPPLSLGFIIGFSRNVSTQNSYYDLVQHVCIYLLSFVCPESA